MGKFVVATLLCTKEIVGVNVGNQDGNKVSGCVEVEKRVRLMLGSAMAINQWMQKRDLPARKSFVVVV